MAGLLLLGSCVDVNAVDLPTSSGGALILVEPTGPAVAAVDPETSRGLLLSKSEGLEAWSYQAAPASLGLRPGLITVDPELGCPLPKPDALFRLEGGAWSAVELEPRSPVLVSAADLGLFERGSFFLDLSCATNACGAPATYDACHLEFNGPGCGISAFSANVDRDGIQPRSVLNKCRSRTPPPGARFSADCFLTSEVVDVPPIPCSFDAYAPVPEPSGIVHSVDLLTVVPPAPFADPGGMIDLGDALLVSLNRTTGEMQECDLRYDTLLIELDRQTLAVRSSTTTALCLTGMVRAGDGFVGSYVEAPSYNWRVGLFDRRGRVLKSAPLSDDDGPNRQTLALGNDTFAVIQNYAPRSTDDPCPTDGSRAWTAKVAHFGLDLVVSSTVIRKIPGQRFDPCGVGLVAMEALSPTRAVAYDQFSRGFLLIQFRPNGGIDIEAAESTPDTRRRILGDLVRIGSKLVAAGGGDHSAIIVDLDTLTSTTIPLTRPVFVLGRRPRVEGLARVDDRRAVALFGDEVVEGGESRVRIEMLELERRPRFVPDGATVGVGRAEVMLVDGDSGDVRVLNRTEHRVYLVPGFVTPRR